MAAIFVFTEKQLQTPASKETVTRYDRENRILLMHGVKHITAIESRM